MVKILKTRSSIYSEAIYNNKGGDMKQQTTRQKACTGVI